MNTATIEYFLLGIAITAVPGPVLIETVRRSLIDKRTVTQFTLGNFLGMIVIVGIVFSGLSVVATSQTISNIFYAACGIVLLYLGVKAMRVKPSFGKKALRSRKQKESQIMAVGSGFVLSVANPVRILLWAALIGKVIQSSTSLSLAAYASTSALAGSMLLFVTVISAIHFLKLDISHSHLNAMSKIFGVILFIYGLATVIKIV